MLPTFPDFKKLTLEDKEVIDAYTHTYPPYSDYNFVSLWSYNTQESIEVSILEENLVIKFLDYFGIEHFYSFFGVSNVANTISLLLNHAESHTIARELALIPEVCIASDPTLVNLFTVEEDPKNFDYILSLENTAYLKGRINDNKRNLVNRFKKAYPLYEQKKLLLHDFTTHDAIINLITLWIEKKGKSPQDGAHELQAIIRLLQSAALFNLVGIGIYIDNILRGFAIAEHLGSEYAVFHFMKADPTYRGIYEMLYTGIATELLAKGALYLNIEQDLGLPGLRHSKEQWNPVAYLKKYTIKRK